MKTLKVDNGLACILIGAMLGTISSFLSIGGGPVNVCVLVMFFSMNTKEAAVNSIITILFSQTPKLITALPKITAGYYDLSMLPVMVIGGILGGMIGSMLNKKFNSNHVLRVLNIFIIALILLNSYNVISVFI